MMTYLICQLVIFKIQPKINLNSNKLSKYIMFCQKKNLEFWPNDMPIIPLAENPHALSVNATEHQLDLQGKEGKEGPQRKEGAQIDNGLDSLIFLDNGLYRFLDFL
jgi:hypothetical protein